MNLPSSQSIAVSPGPGLTCSPERQVQVVVQDAAGFVNRGLAILWREVIGDIANHYGEARRLIETDDLAALGQLLHAYPDLLDYRPPDEEGCQLLHWAARVGSVACVGLLVELGARVDAPNGHVPPDEESFLPGYTPLLLAVDLARVDIAGALLDAGANPDAVLPASCETALHLAAARGLEAMVEALINAGAGLDVMADRHSCDEQLGLFRINTPLHVAALHNRHKIVRMLLKAGANRDACGADGRIALHYAAAHGCVAAMEVLLAAGADPCVLDRCEGERGVISLAPLHYAVRNGQTDAVAMLLCYGAQPGQVAPGCHQDAAAMAEATGNLPIQVRLELATRGETGGSVFSHLDDGPIICRPAAYSEQKAFLLSLLSEFPVGSKSLLVLSDWLAEMLGPENRPHLARAYREVLAGGTD